MSCNRAGNEGMESRGKSVSGLGHSIWVSDLISIHHKVPALIILQQNYLDLYYESSQESIKA